MTTIQRVAQVFGWIFVVVAVWGFFVTGASMEADPDVAPRLWGLFPVNVLHNLVHLALGIWGIMAARSFRGARSYALIAGGLYLVLALLGFVAPAGLGFVPIGGNDIWLHLILAVALLGFGMAAQRPGDAGDRAVADAPRADAGRGTTASSPEATTTRPPAEPGRTTGHDRPVPPETAGSSGASPAAPPPPPSDDVVNEPPRQSDRTPPPGGTEGDRTS